MQGAAAARRSSCLAACVLWEKCSLSSARRRLRLSFCSVLARRGWEGRGGCEERVQSVSVVDDAQVCVARCCFMVSGDEEKQNVARRPNEKDDG